MLNGTMKLFGFQVLLLMACVALIFGCSSGDQKPAACVDIKTFSVLYIEPLDSEARLCRLELSPPPGFEFVDKNGIRLPYHPFVIVKRN